MGRHSLIVRSDLGYVKGQVHQQISGSVRDRDYTKRQSATLWQLCGDTKVIPVLTENNGVAPELFLMSKNPYH